MTQNDILTTRPLVPGDFDAWLPLWGQYLAKNHTKMRWTDRTALFRKLARREDNAGAMVVECDGTMVGIAHFQTHTAPFAFENAYLIRDIYVTPEAQAKRAGAQLVRALYHAAHQVGAPAAYWIAAENTYRSRDKQHIPAIVSPFLHFRKAA